jgi:hypothetical protein
VAQYYVSDNHEAIIPRDIFYKAQDELARRSAKRGVAEKTVKTNRGKFSALYALSELMTCGECSTRYRRVTWARGGKKQIVWRCISRLEYGTQFCKHSPTIPEDRLHAAIMHAVRQLHVNKDAMISSLQEDIRYAVHPAGEQVDRLAIEQRIAELDTQMMTLVSLMGKPSQDISFDKFQVIAEEKESLTAQLTADDQSHSATDITNAKLIELFAALDAHTPALTAYDDSMIRQIVDDVRVAEQGRLRVRFRGGIEIEVEIQR